ncbi:condensation domain-containing protein [Streptomyces gelaticus]
MKIERSGYLTQSQERMWLRLNWRELGSTFPAQRDVWDLPEPVPVPVAVQAWEKLVARHEILRTAFVVGPDNRPVQIVFGADGFQLPLSFADETTLKDFAGERPPPLLSGVGTLMPLWQVRIFLHDQKVASISLTVEHLICDATGIDNWQKQFLELCRGEDVPGPTTQPLDRRHKEDKQRQQFQDAALRKTRSVYERAPGLLVPAMVSEVPELRYLLMVSQYKGVVPLVDAICQSHRVSRSTVFMYALGWSLAQYSGRRNILFSSMFVNRLEQDNGIECQMIPAEILLEIDTDNSIGRELRSAHTTALSGYARHRFSASAPFTEAARAASDRGIGTIEPIMYNYTEGSTPLPSGSVAEREYLDTPQEGESWDTEGAPYCNYLDVYQAGSDITVAFDVDIAMFPKSAIREMSRLLPRFLNFLAQPHDTPVRGADTLVPHDFRVSSDCQLVGENWVRIESVQRLLWKSVHVQDAKVAIEEGELVAWLTLSPEGDVFDVHEYLASQLYGHADTMAPNRYVLAGEPERVWRPDHDLPTLVANTRAEKELCEAIRETHGLEVTNMARTYIDLGGDLLRTPALVQTLRRRGFAGLRQEHFLSPFTLRAIAGSLTHGETE